MRKENKFLILWFTLAVLGILLLSSCSIMKDKSKSKTDTEVKTDITTDTETNTETLDLSKSFTIEPIELSKPYFWNGKRYENAKITYVTNNIQSKENKTEAKKQNTVVSQSVKEKQKTKSEEFSMTWLVWIIVVAGIVVLIGFFILLRLQMKNANAITSLAENVGNIISKV